MIEESERCIEYHKWMKIHEKICRDGSSLFQRGMSCLLFNSVEKQHYKECVIPEITMSKYERSKGKDKN